MKERSRLRHSSDGAFRNVGLDRLRPESDPDRRCRAEGCPYAGYWSPTRTRLRNAVFLCWYHQAELGRLIKDQGTDFGQDGGRVGEARLYYGSRRGYHAY